MDRSLVVHRVRRHPVVRDVGDVNVLAHGGLVLDHELVGTGWHVPLVIVLVGVALEDVFVTSFSSTRVTVTCDLAWICTETSLAAR